MFPSEIDRTQALNPEGYEVVTLPLQLYKNQILQYLYICNL
jgi:hypothetical protein